MLRTVWNNTMAWRQEKKSEKKNQMKKDED